MAYYHSNPDDLPIHAEPEQAAQILSQQNHHPNRKPSYPNQGHGQYAGYGKPQPPIPQQQIPNAHGHGPPNRTYTQGSQGSIPGGFPNSPPTIGAGFPGVGLPARPNSSRPPPTPAPPPGADPTLYPLFKAVDKDGGIPALSQHQSFYTMIMTVSQDIKELRAALVNGDWTSFDPHTVRMMIRMFDTDRDGTIGFNEFCGLWGFLAAWRALFDRFDTDGSGNISYQEYSNALAAFGYRLSPQFVTILFKSYDKRGENAISFDLFVQSCISLKRMTEVFKKYDEDRDGYITLSFEQFLTGKIFCSFRRHAL
ncbi:Peflin [Orbilia brochopaga]|nr:Peflin [Drechslerella brochopaga]